MSALLSRLARKGEEEFFARLLELEKREYGLRYIPADAVGYAVVCPRYGALYAEEREVAVFARALMDRVKYAVLLRIADSKVVDSLVAKAASGDSGAARRLLDVGRGLTTSELQRAFDDLKRDFEHYSKAARGPPPHGSAEEAYHFYKYAEVLPYVGYADVWEDMVIYSIAGIADDYVYVFKYAGGGLQYETYKAMAAAEGDVAAKIWGRRRVKIHIQPRDAPPRLSWGEPKDPAPHYKALRRGECRRGPLCRICPWRGDCECFTK
ncbi:MAG: hypothetical protein OWQ51_01575 [Pyrobaculum arsenaticum]|uniref:Uncharacterized protein n=2 Tax=Pyrobaculum arsenaticum TaxID=121277 RepID=A4WI54_PYRAR|nr:hypothetical protein [Pyrobaculum arsenaticum]ABP50071.1 conserved hypothetical protein [Pyrobaculum arsenaticum DSM 13514]MCY0889665.1 hypothetical protein [Pyrobaculum arsenaticum]NYR14958.1 hypothetical protein [Pyrobaculum arsenaticum]